MTEKAPVLNFETMEDLELYLEALETLGIKGFFLPLESNDE